MGDTFRSRAMDARDNGEPTRWRSMSVNSRIAVSSYRRENSSTSLRIRPSKYCLRQRWASSTLSAKHGSGKPPRSSKWVSATSGSALVCSHHSRTEKGCKRHAKKRPANDSPACLKVSSRALPVTSSCCAVGLPSYTPLSQDFQSGIL